MSLPRSMNNDEYDASIEAARQDCIRQRLELGLNPDPDCLAPDVVLKPMPADVLPFLRRQDDAAFTAPSNIHKLQTDESIVVLRMAQHLADLAYNRELAELPRKQQALCRALACQAMRLTNRNWQDAAVSDAMKACVRWMQTEGGKAFRDLPEHQLELIAVLLVPAILTAYKGISEGSVPMTPGRYLAIVEGRGL